MWSAASSQNWPKLNKFFLLLFLFQQLDPTYFLTCLQVLPASEETNMLISLSDNSEPIFPGKNTHLLVKGTSWRANQTSWALTGFALKMVRTASIASEQHCLTYFLRSVVEVPHKNTASSLMKFQAQILCFLKKKKKHLQQQAKQAGCLPDATMMLGAVSLLAIIPDV